MATITDNRPNIENERRFTDRKPSNMIWLSILVIAVVAITGYIFMRNNGVFTTTAPVSVSTTAPSPMVPATPSTPKMSDSPASSAPMKK